MSATVAAEKKKKKSIGMRRHLCDIFVKTDLMLKAKQVNTLLRSRARCIVFLN